MAPRDLREANLAILNGFIWKPENFPYLVPEDQVKYYLHELIDTPTSSHSP